jgi:hypothetical protein
VAFLPFLVTHDERLGYIYIFLSFLLLHINLTVIDNNMILENLYFAILFLYLLLLLYLKLIFIFHTSCMIDQKE